MGYKPEQVINGTWGELWVDSEYISEVTSLNAKVTPKTETISQSRQLVDGTKITGLECKGEIKLNKVSSRFIALQSDNLKKGIQTEVTIISKLEDPSALGCERVKLIGCVFTEMTLADWELKKNGDETIPFTFRDWEAIDLI
ncbi:tail tube protein [Mobilisporobacter senegalensis]|uniref:Tail tube protein n=1 Tax=Mobilisporobacter senegalensis TaxID=1329262 RepID=A0A3N1XP02_9FIRM|nr:phage tail tube protein [Mobilisporobacter senegalensis]ROR28366.1 tail tube protein [Mobilisporobacter senegalensis]